MLADLEDRGDERETDAIEEGDIGSEDDESVVKPERNVTTRVNAQSFSRQMRALLSGAISY